MTDGSPHAGSRSAARRPCLDEKVADPVQVPEAVGVHLRDDRHHDRVALDVLEQGLEPYRAHWNERLDALERHLEENP